MIARFQDYGTGTGLLSKEHFTNIGIGGTTTGHWIHLLSQDHFRLSQFTGLEHAVVMLGTNNLARLDATAEQISEGVLEVFRVVRSKLKPAVQLWYVPIQIRYDLRDARPTLLDDIRHINERVGQSYPLIGFYADDPQQMESDGLHFTRDTYEALANYIKAQFE